MDRSVVGADDFGIDLADFPDFHFSEGSGELGESFGGEDRGDAVVDALAVALGVLDEGGVAFGIDVEGLAAE